MMNLDEMTLDVEQHVEVKAPIGNVYRSVLHRFGEGNSTPKGESMPMILGNLTQVDSLLANGSPISDWTPIIGTYQVNANCTGTILLHPSTGGFVNLRIVVVKRGTEIHAVVWSPFDGPGRTVTSVGIRVE